MTRTRTREGCQVETNYGKLKNGEQVEHITLSCTQTLHVITEEVEADPYNTTDTARKLPQIRDYFDGSTR